MEAVTRRAAFRAEVVPRLDAGPHSRPERVLHDLDGTRSTVPPAEFTTAGRALWEGLRRIAPAVEDADAILGLDAGGIVPALAISLASGLPYKLAWKVRVPLPGAVHFVEGHANRPNVFAYGITPGNGYVLVDDEVTTGVTLANLAQALSRHGARPVAVACLAEDTRYRAREIIEELGLPLVSLTRIGEGG
ncbi:MULTISPECIES: phosphoribosyltransferase [unclassified Nocardiopsis]|uniref:phosphoribosyltransferase n=1 Tax=unclassified Nocardiopsis TaxID=2649073 RepID=UPI00135B5575|nr:MULTISPECIES: phosphoribosyltransferase [unclassified Nocardiopsis]